MKNLTLGLVMLLTSTVTHAGSKELAYKLHNRLAGVPPKASDLVEMTRLIDSGNMEGAAKIAMANPGFLNLTLKNWVKPWSNREQSSRAPLTDYVATILGIIRDDAPFDRVLYDDVLYVLNDMTLPAYANNNNDHYQTAENNRMDLTTTLVARKQSEMNGLPAAAVAGVTTTRKGGESFFQAGTNRRVNRFIFMNYLCKDYENVHDITVPDFRVARDVERNPGGDSRTYKNRCVGCHAGQDALRGAYAYYNFGNNQVTYSPGQVQGKMNQNNFFPQGFVTTDDNWVNLWATGQNASLGWRGAQSGNGAQSIGMMFSKTKAFSLCMSNKVYKLVCMKEAVLDDEKLEVQKQATAFEANSYSMKSLIAKTSAGCVKDE